MYFVNVVLYLLSLLLFENRILILGRDAGLLTAWLVRFLLVFIPVFIALRLRKLNKEGWILALIFHLYFIINNCASFLESRGIAHSLVRITGAYGSLIYSPTQLLAIFLNSLLNILILQYILKKKKAFF